MSHTPPFHPFWHKQKNVLLPVTAETVSRQRPPFLQGWFPQGPIASWIMKTKCLLPFTMGFICVKRELNGIHCCKKKKMLLTFRREETEITYRSHKCYSIQRVGYKLYTCAYKHFIGYFFHLNYNHCVSTKYFVLLFYFKTRHNIILKT